MNVQVEMQAKEKMDADQIDPEGKVHPGRQMATAQRLQRCQGQLENFPLSAVVQAERQRIFNFKKSGK